MKFSRIILVLSFVLGALPALALDLQQARSNGFVGEKLDGYITTLPGAPADASSLVADVNAQRREEYARISKEKGQPVDVVAKLAAQQIINNLPSGSMYQTSGGWQKR